MTNVGRQLIAQGHVVRLMAPVYVRPHVKAQKNDERDAEAIAEAATRPTMRYVEIKSEAQLEVQSLHRVWGRLVVERTALINQLRTLMLERGISAPQGRCKLERCLPEILSNEHNGLGPRPRRLIEDMREEWRSIDQRIKGVDDDLAKRVREESAASFQRTSSGSVKLALPDRPSIAVLPFKNMSGDTCQDYVGDGLTQDLTSF